VLARHRAQQTERPLLPTEEERLRGDILELRAEVAAARGRHEQSQRQAIAQASGHAAGGRGTRGVSCTDAERNVLSAVYKEATLNAEMGVDQSLQTFDEDVADRFRRRLPGDMSQVARRRTRSTPAIMKELRYGIFPAVHRFKEGYLAVLKLKMTGHPSSEQLINAAKAKYNGLSPYDGLNPTLAVKLSCPPLSNWRIMRDLDKFGGGATVVALRGAASGGHDGPLAQSAPGSESPDADPLALLGNVDDEADDDEFQNDGNGSAPLSSTFARSRSARSKSLFQEQPLGCKASKAASRSELLLHREAAANTAALESLARSAEQRNALAFWSTPEAANSREGRK